MRPPKLLQDGQLEARQTTLEELNDLRENVRKDLKDGEYSIYLDKNYTEKDWNDQIKHSYNSTIGEGFNRWTVYDNDLVHKDHEYKGRVERIISPTFKQGKRIDSTVKILNLYY